MRLSITMFLTLPTVFSMYVFVVFSSISSICGPEAPDVPGSDAGGRGRVQDLPLRFLPAECGEGQRGGAGRCAAQGPDQHR